MKLLLFAPELIVLIGSLLVFAVALGEARVKAARRLTIAIAVVNILVTLGCLYQGGELFFKAYRIDLFSQLFKLVISLGLGAILLFGSQLRGIEEKIRPEYYLFLLLSSLGLMMVVSCVELLSLFVALELSSFALYLLVPMREDRGGLRIQMEAAAKYIMFGVLATGVMLFGMSYVFGLTGSTYFSEAVPALQGLSDHPAAIVAIAMIMGGLFFKLGLFPFHFWLPDVYQGASNETTAFIASVPKVAAVALLIRFATLLAPEDQTVPMLLAVLAIVSMFYGNLIALVQKDIKRMLGFSGIAHAGYVMLGILILKESGFATSIYYIIGYLMMNLACFLVICNVSKDGENVLIDDLSGLHQRAPLLALILAVGMFALAGIPPFVGFMGKFMLLAGALQHDYIILVILAAINTAISIYYYLSVVRVAFTTEAEVPQEIKIGGITKTLGIVLMAVIIIMGVVPSKVLEMATQAVRALL